MRAAGLGQLTAGFRALTARRDRARLSGKGTDGGRRREMQSRSSALRLTGVSIAAALIATLLVAQGRSVDLSFRLLIRTSGGTVTAIGGGVRVRCATSCIRFVRSNAIVRLSALPMPGYVFSRWSGSCVGTAPRCLLIMSATKYVRAVFIATTTTTTTTTRTTAGSHAQLAEIDVTVSGPGIVLAGPNHRIACAGRGPTVDGCHGLYKLGAMLKLRARPNEGHRFATWAFGPGRCGTHRKCQWLVTKSGYFVAAFAP
jgi:hypothetical protein